jgi:hypothetical protein
MPGRRGKVLERSAHPGMADTLLLNEAWMDAERAVTGESNGAEVIQTGVHRLEK